MYYNEIGFNRSPHEIEEVVVALRAEIEETASGITVGENDREFLRWMEDNDDEMLEIEEVSRILNDEDIKDFLKLLERGYE